MIEKLEANSKELSVKLESSKHFVPPKDDYHFLSNPSDNHYASQICQLPIGRGSSYKNISSAVSTLHTSPSNFV